MYSSEYKKTDSAISCVFVLYVEIYIWLVQCSEVLHDTTPCKQQICHHFYIVIEAFSAMSCCLQQKLINQSDDCVHKKLHDSHQFLIPKQKSSLAKNWGISITMSFLVGNVQHCLGHLYTLMRHSKQTATLLLTFDISLVFSSQPKNNGQACGSPFDGGGGWA